MPVTYVFDDHYKGDTFKGKRFQILVNDVPATLSGSLIRMDLRKIKNSPAYIKRFTTEDGSISIQASGFLQVNPVVLDVMPAKYFYDIEVTYPDATVETYVEGTITVVQDTTHG